VGNLILVLLVIYWAFQQWKNFANPPRIDKVIAIIRVAPFFWLTVYFHRVVSFYLSIFFFSSPHLSGRTLDVYHTSTHGVALVWIRMQVWNVLHAARWKYRMQKSPSGTTSLGYIFASKARIDNRKKRLLSSNISSRCFQNMVNFGPLTAEISSGVWGTPANFNGFRVLAALLHDSQVMSISQTLRRWKEGATYIRQATITSLLFFLA